MTEKHDAMLVLTEIPLEFTGKTLGKKFLADIFILSSPLTPSEAAEGSKVSNFYGHK